MKRTDTVLLLLLGSLWGASYLFMRLGAADFGALPFAGVRAALAAALLLPLLAVRGGLGDLRRHWKPIAVVGLANSALPFVLFGYAALRLDAGLSSIFNAATPLYTAAIARVWLGEKLGGWRLAGLGLGAIGVVWLAWDEAGLHPGGVSAAGAVAACLAATLCYGFSANFTRRHLSGVPALASTAGGQLTAVAILGVPALLTWPAQAPSPRAWVALVALAVLSTALAYALFFRLIARIGASRAMAVTYLIPGFGVIWGALFLHETLTWRMGLGGALILAGTGLTTGFLRPRPAAAPAPLPVPAPLLPSTR